MVEILCAWCKHADNCEIRRGLQTRTVSQGTIGGRKEVATIREVVVTCGDYECLSHFPNKGAKEDV